VKKANYKLAFRTESIRRLDNTGLARAAGGKKKDDDEGSGASDTGENHGSEHGGGGSGHGRGITTMGEHQF
jgi:hypothetical protein